MTELNVFIKQRKIKNLERWLFRLVIASVFLTAIFPKIAVTATCLSFVIWLKLGKISQDYKIRLLPLDIPLTLFFIISVASVFFSPVISFSLICNCFAIIAIYGLTYFMIGQTIRKPDQINYVIKALILSACLIVLYGYIQFFSGIDITGMKWSDPEFFPKLHKRIFSTLENPNILAGYIDIFICLLLGILTGVQKFTRKIIIVVMLTFLTVGLIMTYSRGAFITILIIFAFYALWKDRYFFVLLVIFLGFVIYNDQDFLERIISVFTNYDSSEEVRVEVWLSTLLMIADYPLTGIGWGAYSTIFPQYDYYVVNPSFTVYHAHNIYLNYMAEIGLMGALVFFWYLFGTTLLAFTTVRINHQEKFINYKDPAPKGTLKDSTISLDDEKFLSGFKLGIGLAFLSIILNGLTDDLLFNIPSSMIMWQFGALSASIHLMFINWKYE